MAKPLTAASVDALELPELPRAIIRRAMPGIVEDVTDLARKIAPGRRSETNPKSLRANIRGKVLADGLSGVVQATARHAHLVHDGTKAHEVTPRRKQALHGASRGVWHFSMSAPHPGARAQPFLDEARDQSIPAVEERLRVAAEAELREVAT